MSLARSSRRPLSSAKFSNENSTLLPRTASRQIMSVESSKAISRLPQGKNKRGTKSLVRARRIRTARKTEWSTPHADVQRPPRHHDCEQSATFRLARELSPRSARAGIARDRARKGPPNFAEEPFSDGPLAAVLTILRNQNFDN